MAWTAEEVERVLEEVRKRARTDAKYRELALRDPSAAVAQVSREPVPANFKLRFVDNAGAHLTAVLPDLASDDAMSEDELELVAGGMGGIGKVAPLKLTAPIYLSPDFSGGGLMP